MANQYRARPACRGSVSAVTSSCAPTKTNSTSRPFSRAAACHSDTLPVHRVCADARSSVSPAGRSNGSATKYRFRVGSRSRTRRTEEVTWPAAEELNSKRYLACHAHTSPFGRTPWPSRPPSGLPKRWKRTPSGHSTTPCSMRIDASSSNALARDAGCPYGRRRAKSISGRRSLSTWHIIPPEQLGAEVWTAPAAGWRRPAKRRTPGPLRGRS